MIVTLEPSTISCNRKPLSMAYSNLFHDCEYKRVLFKNAYILKMLINALSYFCVLSHDKTVSNNKKGRKHALAV